MKSRNISFDLLRIILIFMVLIIHYMDFIINPGSPVYITIESLCIVCVNVFVIMSGYLLSDKEFSYKRLISLMIEVWTYSLLIPALIYFIPQLQTELVVDKKEILDVYNIWNYIFPVQYEHYWFITAYVIMYLLSPLMNAGLKYLDKERINKVIISLLIIFAVFKSFSPIKFNIDHSGYDFGWFIVLYLIGGYIKKYDITVDKFKSIYTYLISSMMIMVLEYIIINENTHFYMSFPYNFNHLLCLIGSVSFFMIFKEINIKENKYTKLISYVGSSVLAVYLIHQNMFLRYEWANMLRRYISNNAVINIILVFVICIIIEKIRLLTLRIFNRKEMKNNG